MSSDKPARHPGFPIGRTLEGGAYRIDEHIAGQPLRGLYRARRTASTEEATYLVTLGSPQTEEHDVLRAELALPTPGVGRLCYLGPIDPNPWARLDALVEEEPAGAPSTERELPFELITAIDLALAVAEVIAGAHARDLLLVGLRPELVFLRDAPAVTLVGVLPRHDRFLSTMSPSSGAVVNPFPDLYKAPEVLSSQAPEPASDVFSLCAVLAFWATGKHPFPGAHVEQLRAMKRGVRTAWVGSSELGLVVEKGLTPSPVDRATLGEVIDSLRALRAQVAH